MADKPEHPEDLNEPNPIQAETTPEMDKTEAEGVAEERVSPEQADLLTTTPQPTVLSDQDEVEGVVKPAFSSEQADLLTTTPQPTVLSDQDEVEGVAEPAFSPEQADLLTTTPQPTGLFEQDEMPSFVEPPESPFPDEMPTLVDQTGGVAFDEKSMSAELDKLLEPGMSEEQLFDYAMDSQHVLDAATIVYQMGWRWADFQMYIVAPPLPAVNPPVIVPPEPLVDSDGVEFVYPIMDYGFKFATSKATDMVSAGMSMCKLYYTIEKMVSLLIDRLKAEGVTNETEVQVAFAGYNLAQRKGFESIINLTNFNVVVTNFEPGTWGEHYLDTIKRLAEKGYGYPTETPRDIYRHGTSTITLSKK